MNGKLGWHAQVRVAARPSGNLFQLYSIFTLLFVFSALNRCSRVHVCAAPVTERERESVRLCVCLHSHLSIHGVCLWMYLHVDKVAIACGIPHVCVLRWCVDAGTAVSPRSREAGGVGGGDKYTSGTLSAATQTRAGSSPAVRRGLYLCMCVTLRV